MSSRAKEKYATSANMVAIAPRSHGTRFGQTASSSSATLDNVSALPSTPAQRSPERSLSSPRPSRSLPSFKKLGSIPPEALGDPPANVAQRAPGSTSAAEQITSTPECNAISSWESNDWGVPPENGEATSSSAAQIDIETSVASPPPAPTETSIGSYEQIGWKSDAVAMDRLSYRASSATDARWRRAENDQQVHQDSDWPSHSYDRPSSRDSHRGISPRSSTYRERRSSHRYDPRASPVASPAPPRAYASHPRALSTAGLDSNGALPTPSETAIDVERNNGTSGSQEALSLKLITARMDDFAKRIIVLENQAAMKVPEEGEITVQSSKTPSTPFDLSTLEQLTRLHDQFSQLESEVAQMRPLLGNSNLADLADIARLEHRLAQLEGQNELHAKQVGKMVPILSKIFSVVKSLGGKFD